MRPIEITILAIFCVASIPAVIRDYRKGASPVWLLMLGILFFLLSLVIFHYCDNGKIENNIDFLLLKDVGYWGTRMILMASYVVFFGYIVILFIKAISFLRSEKSVKL